MQYKTAQSSRLRSQNKQMFAAFLFYKWIKWLTDNQNQSVFQSIYLSTNPFTDIHYKCMLIEQIIWPLKIYFEFTILETLYQIVEYL